MNESSTATGSALTQSLHSFIASPWFQGYRRAYNDNQQGLSPSVVPAGSSSVDSFHKPIGANVFQRERASDPEQCPMCLGYKSTNTPTTADLARCLHVFQHQYLVRPRLFPFLTAVVDYKKWYRSGKLNPVR